MWYTHICTVQEQCSPWVVGVVREEEVGRERGEEGGGFRGEREKGEGRGRRF